MYDVLRYLTRPPCNSDSLGAAAELVRVTRASLVVGALGRGEVVRAALVLRGNASAAREIFASSRSDIVGATSKLGRFAITAFLVGSLKNKIFCEK